MATSINPRVANELKIGINNSVNLNGLKLLRKKRSEYILDE